MVANVCPQFDTPRDQARSPAPLIDANGAAELLSVPRSWVLSEARAARIPHVRLGRYVRFDPDELAAWWQTRARGPWRDRGEAAAEAKRWMA
jgi:excisionase family DNA binding protein